MYDFVKTNWKYIKYALLALLVFGALVAVFFVFGGSPSTGTTSIPQ